jgi:RecA/RadA recombinase
MALPNLQLALPERLQRLVPATRRGLAFGIPALDAALPSGISRGQITALNAPLGSGGTTLLLALAATTLAADEGVAIVDAERSLAPQAAAHLAALGPFWVIRPRTDENAWWCADVLLRTGAFGLVIVDRSPAPPRRIAVRLQRLAHDKDCALVMRVAPTARRQGDSGLQLPGYGAAVVLEVQPPASGAGFVPALAGWGGCG